MLAVLPKHACRNRDARGDRRIVFVLSCSEAIARIDERSQQFDRTRSFSRSLSLSPRSPLIPTLTSTIAGAQPLPRGLQHGTGRWLVRSDVFIENANNPKKRKKIIAKTCFLFPLQLAHSVLSLFLESSLFIHRAYVLFLTFAEVAKGGWTREVFKVNWCRLFFHLAKKNRRFFVFVFDPEKKKLNLLPLSLSLFSRLRASLFQKNNNRPSTSR